MRVLHVYKTSETESFGGIESVIQNLAYGAAAKGIDVDVLCLSRNPNPNLVEINGYKIHRVRLSFEIASAGFSFDAFKEYKRLASNADVINFHYPWPFMDILHMVSGVKKPYIITYHSDIIRQKYLSKIYFPLMMWFLKNASAIVATSPNYVESSKILQRFIRKTIVIPIGLSRFSKTLTFGQKYHNVGELSDKDYFLYLGALRYYKNISVLLEASVGTDAKFVIAGTGLLYNKLKKLAEKLGAQNVIFLGAVSENRKEYLLRNCKALILPSHSRAEAFGVCLLEAAKHGKPLISCEIGTGTTYINVHDVTGLVVPPNDPLALRDAIQKLAHYPDLCYRLGAGAKQRFENLFTADQMVDSYISLYLKTTKE